MRQEISVRDCQKGKGEGEGDAVDDDEWLMRLCCVTWCQKRSSMYIRTALYTSDFLLLTRLKPEKSEGI